MRIIVSMLKYFQCISLDSNNFLTEHIGFEIHFILLSVKTIIERRAEHGNKLKKGFFQRLPKKTNHRLSAAFEVFP